jgi:hypothetical protein
LLLSALGGIGLCKQRKLQSCHCSSEASIAAQCSRAKDCVNRENYNPLQSSHCSSEASIAAQCSQGKGLCKQRKLQSCNCSSEASIAAQCSRGKRLCKQKKLQSCHCSSEASIAAQCSRAKDWINRENYNPVPAHLRQALLLRAHGQRIG